jgi:hypothetical protein
MKEKMQTGLQKKCPLQTPIDIVMGANCARVWFVYKLTAHQLGVLHVLGATRGVLLAHEKSQRDAGF